MVWGPATPPLGQHFAARSKPLARLGRLNVQQLHAAVRAAGDNLNALSPIRFCDVQETFRRHGDRVVLAVVVLNAEKGMHSVLPAGVQNLCEAGRP